jgi:hypothetical protein
MHKQTKPVLTKEQGIADLRDMLVSVESAYLPSTQPGVPQDDVERFGFVLKTLIEVLTGRYPREFRHAKQASRYIPDLLVNLVEHEPGSFRAELVDLANPQNPAQRIFSILLNAGRILGQCEKSYSLPHRLGAEQAA